MDNCEYIRNKYQQEIKSLISLINTYSFFDACRAIYCINSYLLNRAHLELSLVLNYSLISCLKNGDLSIDNYDSFIEFVNKINRIIQPDPTEDNIVIDNGEFKIPFLDKFYSVFLGNSYSYSFPIYQSIDALAKKFCFDKEFEEILKYQDTEISNISNCAIPEKYDYRLFNIPTKEYFDKTIAYYKEIDNKVLHSFATKAKFDIYKSHFVEYKSKILRLFNTSLVIDTFYSYLNKYLDKAPDICFYDSLRKNFAFYDNSNDALLNVGIIDDFDRKTIIKDFVFKGAVFDLKHLILFSNCDDFKSVDEQSILNKIVEKIKKKSLYIIEISNDRTRMARLDKLEDCLIIKYDPFIDISTAFHVLNTSANICLLDLISLFYQVQAINDLIEFLRLYLDGKMEKVFSIFSGVISKYNYWFNNKKLLSKGAINYDLISLDVYDNEYLLQNDYKSFKNWFPFNSSSAIFLNPYRWTKYGLCNDFIEISDKSTNNSFGGLIKIINNRYLFFVFNLDLFDNKNFDSLTILQTIQEMSTVYSNKIEGVLIDAGILKYDVELLYMPLAHAQNVDNTGFTKTKNKYVYSDAMISDNKVLIRYTTNNDAFAKDMANSKDNNVEIQYLLELFSCLSKISSIDFDLLKESILKLKGKKSVKLVQQKIEYYKSDKLFDVKISDFMLSKVDKLFAIECKKVGLFPGKYEKTKFTKNIRKMQENVIPIFETEISKFNKTEVHKLLLAILSTKIFDKHIDDDRLRLTASDELDEDAKEISRKNAIKSRANHLSSIRFLYYLIDVNLSIDRNSVAKPNLIDIEYLIVFSKRLVTFQDSSDQAHYGLLPLELIIDSDYIPQVLYSENSNDILMEREKRRCSIQNYLPSLDFDKSYLEKTSHCFKEDTGVSLFHVLDICNYLKYEFFYTFKNEILPNVFSVNYNELILDIKNFYANMPILDIKKAVDYLIIETTKIKMIDDKMEKFVPIWEREKREHRFETRPLSRDKNTIIFSPIVVNDFADKWRNAIFNFYLLYEAGLTKTKNFLTEWKHKCEKKMERDIKDMFAATDAIQSVKLHKIDKLGKHPDNLGDYDVLAVDRKKRILYNLEAKFLIFTGSVRENYNLQYAFFIGDKKDEHYQKRIDYLSSNYERVLEKLFSIKDYKNYKVISYMVTNKMFYCDIKTIKFEMITFSELKYILSGNDK